MFLVKFYSFTVAQNYIREDILLVYVVLEFYLSIIISRNVSLLHAPARN